MVCGTAVGIRDNLSSGESGIREGGAENETAGGVHQDMEIRVQIHFFCRFLHDAFYNGSHFLQADLFIVLCGQQESVNAVCGIIKAYLRLCIRL